MSKGISMSFTAEQKSQLAKLLATENLTVQHQKISTARFDTKNRILYLPIWQNMTGYIYDLLVGHEVGHALYTPPEGWHDAVTENDKNKNYKNFLNVVEDARIEKKVKRKYPGLNSAFRLAYQELNNRDFFGIKDREVNELSFIDRLNLFSKSQWQSTWIKFSANEELLIKEVQAAETWDDVLRITEKVYQYSKEEQHEMALQYYDEMMAEMSDEYGDDYDMSDYDGDSDDGEDDYGEGEGASANDEFEEGESKSKRSQAGDAEEAGDDELDESGKSIKHDKLSAPGDKDQFEPTCETDENYRRNENQLLDDKCKEFVYVDFPKPNLDAIVTPAKRVQELLTNTYQKFVNEKIITPTKGIELLNEFKRRNERYVSLLAKEFEMRKAAKAFSKSKLSDTGDIDINKLSSYKFDDNIFRKVMLTPKGKSHGLVLLLDRSGSMSKNMSGSIEQILVLAMFCRKVNIPFVVYGFTESSSVRAIDLGFQTPEQQYMFKGDYTFNPKHRSFSSNEFEMKFGDVHLREYLNSKMSNAEFTNSMKNMCLLMEAYKDGVFNHRMPRPDSESLNNTPMIEAVVATAKIMKDFKRQHNLDITSLVVVHDGDADGMNTYWKQIEKTNYETGKKEMVLGYDFFQVGNYVYYVRDRENKFETKMNGSWEDISRISLEWFKKVTGARVFGFFILAGRNDTKYAINERYVNENGKTYWQVRGEVGPEDADVYRKKLLKQFKDEKFLMSRTPGYESFFLIHGGEELTTEDENGIEIEGKFTAKKLATAFAKYNKKRAVNRVLVSRFIQGIAA
jgi:hypothetical protein